MLTKTGSLIERWRIRTIGGLMLAIACVGVGSPVYAVILGSGNDASTNRTDSSLQSYGGPGSPSQPGFDNVGLSSTHNASITYLDNGWAITAAHVTINGTVRFGGTDYTIGMTRPIYNQNTGIPSVNGTPADLQMVHLSAASPYPSIAPIGLSQIDSNTPSGQVIMIGNGLSAGPQLYWQADTTKTNWQWTQLASAPSASPPSGDVYYSGFIPSGGQVIRWGENNVNGTALVQGNGYNTLAFTTYFDDQTYTHVTPLHYEAQGSNGDSGGAVFSQVGGQWQLSGIMTDGFGTENNPPSGAEFFADQTDIADLSRYSAQIAQIMANVPEPSSLGLAALAALLLLARSARRRAGKQP